MSQEYRRGAVVYRRLWKRWCVKLERLVNVRCQLSPYQTGRILSDLGDRVLVEVHGAGRGKNITAEWPKDGRLQVSHHDGIGPSRCEKCPRAKG